MNPADTMSSAASILAGGEEISAHGENSSSIQSLLMIMKTLSHINAPHSPALPAFLDSQGAELCTALAFEIAMQRQLESGRADCLSKRADSCS